MFKPTLMMGVCDVSQSPATTEELQIRVHELSLQGRSQQPATNSPQLKHASPIFSTLLQPRGQESLAVGALNVYILGGSCGLSASVKTL